MAEESEENVKPPKKAKIPQEKKAKPVKAIEDKGEEILELSLITTDKIHQQEKILQVFDLKYAGVMSQVQSAEFKNYVSQNKLDKATDIGKDLKAFISTADGLMASKVGKKTMVAEFLKNAAKLTKECKIMFKEFLDQSSKYW